MADAFIYKYRCCRARSRACTYVCVGYYGRAGSGRLLVEAIFSSCEERKEGNGSVEARSIRIALLSLIEFFNLARPVDKSRARLRPPRGDINIPPPPREKFDIRGMSRRIEGTDGGGKYMGLFSVYGNVRRVCAREWFYIRSKGRNFVIVFGGEARSSIRKLVKPF